MSAESETGDVREIREILARQLANITWTAGKDSDWAAFSEDFLPDVSLYAATRTAKSQPVETFVERMKSLPETGLKSFEQSMLSAEVHVFGSVDIAFGVCRNLENGTDEIRGIEAYLLVKDDGSWKIASQTWDTENDFQIIPEYLLAEKNLF
ncbi:MAG: hypothetical protein CL569_17350 [Alphaproteobacteria bacterium]|nr:hypothetical protein [Alphaproteobacteria bacterium]|tara:strand:+ start:339 stop:794 length:456 start_codon:yes stop_codon:yes gene_type:complete